METTRLARPAISCGFIIAAWLAWCFGSVTICYAHAGLGEGEIVTPNGTKIECCDLPDVHGTAISRPGIRILKPMRWVLYQDFLAGQTKDEFFLIDEIHNTLAFFPSLNELCKTITDKGIRNFNDLKLFPGPYYWDVYMFRYSLWFLIPLTVVFLATLAFKRTVAAAVDALLGPGAKNAGKLWFHSVMIVSALYVANQTFHTVTISIPDNSGFETALLDFFLALVLITSTAATAVIIRLAEAALRLAKKDRLWMQTRFLLYAISMSVCLYLFFGGAEANSRQHSRDLCQQGSGI